MNTIEQWQKSRVNLVTDKSTGELKELDEELNSRAFLISKLTQRQLVNDLRPVVDDFSAGRITMTDAQERFRELAGNNPDEIAKNLATRSRATAVLNTQRQLARGVGQWKVWQETAEDFPCIIYHANLDGFVRPSHRALNGKVYAKDDPFLQTHMPGEWDYNCRCWGEQCTAKKAARLGGPQPKAEASYDAESGFKFNPANAFRENDVSGVDVKDRAEVVSDLADAVRQGRLKKIGLLVASPEQSYPRASLAGLDDMTRTMRKTQNIALESAEKAGWNPKLQPGHERQDEQYKKNNEAERTDIPGEIVKDFPEEMRIGVLSRQSCLDAGFGEETLPVTLEAGDRGSGLVHNWIHHKEVFVDPEEGERILRATLGNPNAQISVTLEKKDGKVRRLLTFFDPRTKSYCVAVYDEEGKKLKLMSWHRSPASYGESQWEVSGGKKADRERKRAWYQARRDQK